MSHPGGWCGGSHLFFALEADDELFFRPSNALVFLGHLEEKRPNLSRVREILRIPQDTAAPPPGRAPCPYSRSEELSRRWYCSFSPHVPVISFVSPHFCFICVSACRRNNYGTSEVVVQTTESLEQLSK